MQPGVVLTVVLIVAGLIVVLLVALAVWAIVVRNALVRRRNSAQEALQGIDVALEARFDRIAAQKNAAAGAVQREVDTILGATALRTGRPVSQLTVEEKARAADAAQRAEHALLNVEAYPAMESLRTVEILQRSINEAEERLQAARRLYNSEATAHNTARDVFPQNLVAGMLGHGRMDLFEISSAAKAQPHDLEGFLDA
ncbi:MAG TPA: LemA family protein [Candidatus Brevibacterium intestinigallinarum]|nr:LemA family protein [Candidatus Brevibacterium intestinigallinarum]